MMLKLRMRSNGASHRLPQLISCEGRANIYKAIIHKVAELKNAGVPYRDQAILCRGRADIEFIAERLHELGIPALFIGELAHRPEVKLLLCLMQLLCEREPRALVGLTKVPGFSMPMPDIARLLELSRNGIEWQRGRWLSNTSLGLSTQGEHVRVALHSLLNGFARYSTPWHFVCEMLLEYRFGMPDPADISIESQTARIALWQFAHSVRSSDGDIKQATLSRYLTRQQLRQRIGETYADREPPPEALEMNAIRLLTVHGSKGLEYDAVHLGYVEENVYGPNKPTWGATESITDLVPPSVLGSSDEEYEFESAVERNNLFYVALSRAKRHLNLYEDTEFGLKRPPQLKDHMARYEGLIFNPVPAISPVSAINQGAFPPTTQPVRFDEFETYTRCALQHYYRFSLGLAREQDTDVAVRARWAVMDALKENAKSGTDLKTAFLGAWANYRLPDKTEDLQLWDDAVAVLKKGRDILHANKGTFIEKPVATLAGLKVELPWVIETNSPSLGTLHLLRFSPKGIDDTKSLLRPLLLEVNGKKHRPMMLHTLLGNRLVEVPPSYAPNKTNAFKAAIRMLGGTSAPSKGRHCSRCAYLTICPITPQRSS